MRPITVIESPYSDGGAESNLETAIDYAAQACLHSVNSGEAPIASHLLYTQFLNDNDPVERMIGIECGMEFSRPAKNIAFYIDHGISRGMFNALLAFSSDERLSSKVVFRSLNGDIGTIHAIGTAYNTLVQIDCDYEGWVADAESLFAEFLKPVTSAD